MVTVNGLVIRERTAKENDKYLTILTDTLGLIEVSAKGVKKANSKNASVAQMFCYAKYCLSEGKSGYILNCAEPIRIFYQIRLDITAFALASYFCELLLYVCAKEQPNKEALRLMLNTLHFLSDGKRDMKMLKAIFELRLMSEIGLVPNLIGCCKCYKYTDRQMQFDLGEGRIYCEDCCGSKNLRNCEVVDGALLHSLRFIALSDMSKIFNFTLNNDHLIQLSNITERYVEIQLDKHFKTLDFYKSLI